MRQSRVARRMGQRPIKLQERDFWILEGLGKTRFLTTTQISRLYFGGSRWAAHKGMRRLLDAGLVRVWVRNLASENIYSMDRAGANVLTRLNDLSILGDISKTVFVPRGLDGQIEHVILINDVRVAMAQDSPEEGGELLWWRSDWELREVSGRGVIPDALFAIRWEEGEEQVYALEVDNNTRSVRSFLKKATGYLSTRREHWRRYGADKVVVLVAGREAKWLARYQEALSHMRFRLPVFFSTLAAIREKGANAEIWTSAAGVLGYSLRQASCFPCGKEGAGGLSQVETAT